MKNAEMTYGALSAKIRALYGKRLRADDFARLAGLKNEAELLEAQIGRASCRERV